MDGLPLIIRLVRPDEVEAHRYTLTESKAGGYAVDIPISASARTGAWVLQAYLDPKGDPIGSLNFLVEDVVPAKIETKLTTKATAIEPGQPSEVTLQSDYLYGAPGADLLVKAGVTIEQDSDPFAKAFPGYTSAWWTKRSTPGRDLGRHHHRCQGSGELRHDAHRPAGYAPAAEGDLAHGGL
jgi:Large extracellular alpha-helical protein